MSQISLRNKIIAFVAIGFFAVAALFSYQNFQDTKQSSPIRTELVAKRNLEVSILATGVVQPQNRVEIKPPISGRIEKVLVDEGDMVNAGQVIAWMSSTERAAMLDAARARGTKELKKWQDLYRPTPIIAPINGMIIQKAIEPGQTFSSSDSIMVLSDRLTVNAQVDETDIGQVKAGQKAIVTLDAYPQTQIPAVVEKIAFEASTINNVTTYIVELLPKNVPEFMRSGMTANVTFKVASLNDIIAISSEALKVDDDQFYVLILPASESSDSQTKQQVERRMLNLGLSDGKWTEVKEGLAVGEKILLSDPRIEKGEVSGGSPLSPFGRRSRSRSSSSR